MTEDGYLNPAAGELVEAHLSVAEAVARKMAGRNEQLFADLHGACLEGLVEAARAFDPARCHNGDAGFAPWAVTRCRYSALLWLRKQKRHTGVVSVEELATGGEGGETVLADRRADDPARQAQAREAVLTGTVARNGRVTLAQVEARAPVDGAGAWVADLRAACFDAVSTSDMREVMQAVVRRAKKGNLNAAKLLLDYLAGGKAGVNVRQTVVVRQDDGVEP